MGRMICFSSVRVRRGLRKKESGNGYTAATCTSTERVYKSQYQQTRFAVVDCLLWRKSRRNQQLAGRYALAAAAAAARGENSRSLL